MVEAYFNGKEDDQGEFRVRRASSQIASEFAGRRNSGDDGEIADLSDDEEVKNASDLLPELNVENEEESETLFNPQEIDFSEVERLRTKVATLESILAKQGQ